MSILEGTPVYVKGSAAKPYELKNVGGVYSCTCPAWRNQSAAIDRRTCKHLRSVLGDAAEEARTSGGAAPVPSLKPVPKGAEAARILKRAEDQGRKLRQDEKAKLHGPPLLLAHPFEGSDVDPTGWWWSEKLDGVRAYWNGENFISRQGNVFHAPERFKVGLPKHPLDGELWLARKSLEKTISIVRRQDAGDAWLALKYIVFDAPARSDVFEKRLAYVELLVSQRIRSPYVESLVHRKVKSTDHLRSELAKHTAEGAEGLMIRQPGSLYEVGRSSTLLKVKAFKEAEAVVVAHVAGKGRHKGRLGALTLRMPSGLEFNLGTGFSDDQREDPPAIGATVTYSYTELTNGGIPKCTGFVAVRDYE